MDIKELIKVVKEKGIAGAGGAGFPTYGKIDKRANTILLNCAECEPLLKVHRQLLQKYAYEIMYALNEMAKAMEVNEIVIAVKETFNKAIAAVKENMESFPNITLKQLPEIYPMGDEVILIYETLNKKISPGSIPIEAGVAVFNVETVYNVYQALVNNQPVITKYLTIAGEVKSPITVKAPLGMKVDEVVNIAGGTTLKNPIYIMGGPMTGRICEPYDTVTKTTNAILVLPGTHKLIQKMTTNTSIDMKRAMSVCCQCEMCTDLCPRNMLGHPITPHMFMRSATSGATKDLSPYMDTLFCSACGVCELYACPQDLSPRKLITAYKNGLRKNGIAIPKDIPLKETNQMREYRKIPMERLTKRLGLSMYNLEAPLYDQLVNVEQVKITFNQNIGVKPKSIVHKGDKVTKGDVIAQSVEDKLSLSVHASLTGTIKEVNENFVIIQV